MSGEVVYLNGSLIPLSQARISPLDHGFLYGYGLFETMRAYGGAVFHLKQHLERLYDSAAVLKLGQLPPKEQMVFAIHDMLAANLLKDARIRLSVSAGEGEMTPDPGTCKSPIILMLARNYTPLSQQTYKKGYSAVLSSFRRDSQSLLSRLKTFNYIASILARGEARSREAEEAVMLNEKGLLTECSTSNLFLVKGSVLYTPPVESGLLPGITRQTILELAPHEGIDTRINELPLDSLINVDEAFITNSLMEIMPLTTFNNSPVGKGQPGPVTKRLIAAYARLVDQIRNDPEE